MKNEPSREIGEAEQYRERVFQKTQAELTRLARLHKRKTSELAREAKLRLISQEKKLTPANLIFELLSLLSKVGAK